MIVSLCFSMFILGALWRRWVGLAGSGPRGLKLVFLPLLLFPTALVHLPWYTTGELTLWLPVVVAALAALFMLVKVDSAKPWPRLFIFGLGYPLAKRFCPDFRWENFIDGPTAIGELFLGGSLIATVDLVAVLL